MVNNGINEKVNINSTYCVGFYVLTSWFLRCRLRLPCWFAHIWRTWPDLRFMLLWLEDLLQLQAVSWGHSSHLGWAQNVVAPHCINLRTGPYFFLQKRRKGIFLDYITYIKRDNQIMCFSKWKSSKQALIKHKRRYKLGRFLAPKAIVASDTIYVLVSIWLFDNDCVIATVMEEHTKATLALAGRADTDKYILFNSNFQWRLTKSHDQRT